MSAASYRVGIAQAPAEVRAQLSEAVQKQTMMEATVQALENSCRVLVEFQKTTQGQVQAMAQQMRYSYVHFVQLV